MTNSKNFTKQVGKTVTLYAYIWKLPDLNLRLLVILMYFMGFLSLSNRITNMLHRDYYYYYYYCLYCYFLCGKNFLLITDFDSVKICQM